MPDSINKLQSLKKFYPDPDDRDTFVKYPVTDQISFSDPKDSGQEIVIRFNNGANSSRGQAVRIQRVKRKTGTPESYDEGDDADAVDVERPIAYTSVDPKTDEQTVGTRFNLLDAQNSWPAMPEMLSNARVRELRHVVRYTSDNTLEGSPWVDLELVDLLPVTDPKTDTQETIYRIKYAERGPPIDDPDDPYEPTFAIADPSLPDAPEWDDIDPPHRTSPLENIVNFGGAPILVLALDATVNPGEYINDLFLLTAPLVPAVPAAPPKPGIPEIPEFVNIQMGANLSSRKLNISDADVGNDPAGWYVPSAGAAPIETPFTKEMLKKNIMWVTHAPVNIPDPFSIPSLPYQQPPPIPSYRLTSTIFINLKKYSTKQKEAVFKVRVPGVGTPVVLEWQGPPFIEDGVPRDGPIHHYTPAQRVLTWKLRAMVSSRRDFPVSDLDEPTWDISGKGKSYGESVGSGGPLPSQIITITVKFPSQVTVTIAPE